VTLTFTIVNLVNLNSSLFSESKIYAVSEPTINRGIILNKTNEHVKYKSPVKKVSIIMIGNQLVYRQTDGPTDISKPIKITTQEI